MFPFSDQHIWITFYHVFSQKFSDISTRVVLRWPYFRKWLCITFQDNSWKYVRTTGASKSHSISYLVVPPVAVSLALICALRFCCAADTEEGGSNLVLHMKWTPPRRPGDVADIAGMLEISTDATRFFRRRVLWTVTEHFRGTFTENFRGIHFIFTSYHHMPRHNTYHFSARLAFRKKSCFIIVFVEHWLDTIIY